MYPVLKRHTLASWVYLVLLGFAVWHLAKHYPLMPDRMASHFGAGGVPDGWSSKDHFFLLFGVMLTVMTAMFGGLAFLIPALPASTINIPNREYYLSPENRERTYGILVSYMLWFGAATTAFMILVAEETFRANLEPSPRLGDGFLIGLVAYLLLAVLGTIVLIMRFRKPPTA